MTRTRAEPAPALGAGREHRVALAAVLGDPREHRVGIASGLDDLRLHDRDGSGRVAQKQRRRTAGE